MSPSSPRSPGPAAKSRSLSFLDTSPFAATAILAFLLPPIVVVGAIPLFLVSLFVGVFVFQVDSYASTAVFTVLAGVGLVGLAFPLHRFLRRVGLPRPRALVCLLYLAMALPAIQLPLSMFLSDTGAGAFLGAIGPEAEGVPWIIGAYLHLAVLCAVLFLCERRRRSRDGLPSGAGSVPDEDVRRADRRVILRTSAALAAAFLITGAVTAGIAERSTLDRVAEDAAGLGDHTRPLVVLDGPGWRPWHVRSHDDREELRIAYMNDDREVVEVHTMPFETVEEGFVEERSVEAPGLSEREARAAFDVLPGFVPEGDSLFVELPETGRVVALYPGIDGRHGLLQGTARFDVTGEELLELVGHLRLLDPGDTEAVRELALQARTAR
ncbi:hypothetical protein ACFWZ7_18550 [Nocardiopsis alba]|uniref:hypothetical protein n=1 Tax=Nocardiopsis alba TaxID=53437 RepID=UPI00366EB249